MCSRNLSWYGQKVERIEGDVALLNVNLPTFKLMPCGKNEYIRMVVREKRFDKPAVPVATVSRDYTLIQHGWFLDKVVDSLKDMGLSIDGLHGTLDISEYGERIQILLQMPVPVYDPGDGHPLAMMMHIYNSVDKTCALEIGLRWIRVICNNALVIDRKSDFKRAHIGKCIDEVMILEQIKWLLNSASFEAKTYKKWLQTSVDIKEVQKWANTTLANKWGQQLAKRTMHIAEYGCDIQRNPVLWQFAGIKQDDFETVPGACAPITNVYHLSQVLSWLASQRNTVDGQMKKLNDIPKLIEPFLPKNKSLPELFN